MKIIKVQENKKKYIDLLLLADPQEDMIDRYLDSSDLFALYDNGLKGICAVCGVGAEECEIKNLAVYEQFHRQGYGKALLDYVSYYYKGKCSSLILGTGEVPSILTFYSKCGFEIYNRIPNFFTDNYDEPIYEEGILLKDMIYLRKNL